MRDKNRLEWVATWLQLAESAHYRLPVGREWHTNRGAASLGGIAIPDDQDQRWKENEKWREKEFINQYSKDW